MNLIELELNDPSHQILDMNKVNVKYLLKKIYRALNLFKLNIQTNRNKFAQNKHKEKHYITYRKTKNKISILITCVKIARFLRKDILDRDKWVSTGTFNDFKNPPMLHTFK